MTKNKINTEQPLSIMKSKKSSHSQETQVPRCHSSVTIKHLNPNQQLLCTRMSHNHRRIHWML